MEHVRVLRAFSRALHIAHTRSEHTMDHDNVPCARLAVIRSIAHVLKSVRSLCVRAMRDTRATICDTHSARGHGTTHIAGMRMLDWLLQSNQRPVPVFMIMHRVEALVPRV